jgi:3',5'-cyclic AMP phosphodiesterase CpdA
MTSPRIVALLAVISLSRLVAAAANDFKFSILGDRTGFGSPQIYERVWAEIDAVRPDFVLGVGDSIAGLKDSRAGAEWLAVRRIWQRYRYPLYLAPGNHDIWNEYSRRLFEKETGHAPHFSFNFQGAHFTILDNSGSLLLTDAELKFLEDDLEANRDRAPKFVIFHQPFWIFFLKLGSGQFELHRLAREYGVNFVFSGHGHQLLRVVRDGVSYIEAGSSGANIARGTERGAGFDEGWFYQHLVVTVKGTKTTVQVKQLGGKLYPVERW